LYITTILTKGQPVRVAFLYIVLIILININMAQLSTDYRAKLQAKDPKFYGDGPMFSKTNLLNPIRQTNGMIMPYTPMIQVTHAQVEYQQYNLPQTNFDYYAYSRRASPYLSVTAQYTAQNQDEAQYMLSVIHFLRAATMSYYGIQNTKKRGIPPPVLLFSAYGPYMYDKIPVLVRNVSFGLEQDVDYVPCMKDESGAGSPTNPGPGNPNAGIDGPVFAGASGMANKANLEAAIAKTYVPAMLNIFLDIVYAPIPAEYRREFDLDKFKTGQYAVSKGDKFKGFI
tara:strand:- start:3695 stop:4546 length:852 start_codon:yes stop_codon:yes gene_type:complete